MRVLMVLLAFVMLLVTVSGAVAQPQFPPFQESSGADVLTLLFPKIDRYALDSNVTLHFYVFNGSGLLLDNDSVSCYIHLYNELDGHLRKEQMFFDGIDFELRNTNTSHAGYYPYNAWCNDSVVGGFATGAYWVSAGGAKEQGSSPSGILFLAVIPLVIGLFLLIGGVSLSNEEHPFVKIFLFLLSFVMAFVSMQFGSMAVSRFYNYPEVVDAIGSFTLWFTIVWGVLVTYFVIYGIIVMIRQAAQEKDERLRY